MMLSSLLRVSRMLVVVVVVVAGLVWWSVIDGVG